MTTTLSTLDPITASFPTVSFTTGDAAALAALLGELDGPASGGPGAATDVIRAFALGHPHIGGVVESTYPAATSLVHLEQEIVLHAPLHPDTPYAVAPAVRGGRPQGDGSVVRLSADLHDPETGDTVATLTGSVLLAGVAPLDADPLPTRRPAAVPLAPPHVVTVPYAVDRDTVASYADLAGDHNPIHLDPDAARAAGFEDCIAHGMSVVGVAVARALAHVAPDGDGPARVAAVGVRFAQPAVVGDEVTITLQATTDSHELRLGATSSRGPVLKAGWVRFDRPVTLSDRAGDGTSEKGPRTW